MDRIEINQEILLLQGAFCTQAHLRLNLDGSDSASLRKAALIIVKTIREIEQIIVRKSKQLINESLHYAILSRTIFSNCKSALENGELEELAESSQKALPYLVTWPLYFECVRVAKWESLLEKTWKLFNDEIVHQICNQSLDYVTARPKDSQNFGVACAAYRTALSEEKLLEETFKILENMHTYLLSFLENLPQLPTIQHSSITLQTFRMFSDLLARTNNWNAADMEHGFKYSSMFSFWCKWVEMVITVIVPKVLADDKLVDVKEEVVSVAHRCHGQVNAIVERKEWFGVEMVREAEQCSRMLCESGLVSDEEESHLARYLCDVQTKNGFWKGSLQKLLERPDAFTDIKISNCLMENVTLDLEHAITLSRQFGINLIFTMVNKSFPRWPPNDIDKFIAAHHCDKTTHPLSYSNQEYETELTTLFNRLSACSKMDQNNTSLFAKLCFKEPVTCINRVLRYALDCGKGDLVIWLMSSYPMTCRMKMDNEELCLLGQCCRSILYDAHLTIGQEDNIKPVLVQVSQSNDVKMCFAECFKSFFYDVLLKQSVRDPNRRVLSIMPIFFDIVQNCSEYDPVCLLVYFCRMLHYNIGIELRKVNAKSLSDKEDIIGMINRTTTSVALRHTLQENHVSCWLSSQLDTMDPKVSYYLYDFLEKVTLEDKFLQFSGLSSFTLTSLVTLDCCSPNPKIMAHIASRLEVLEHPYWEMAVCIIKILPTSTKQEFRSIVSLLSNCGHLISKTPLGLLTDAILMLTKTPYLTQECCANLMENYAYSIQELLNGLDEGLFVAVFLDACRLFAELPQYLKTSARAIVLELAVRCTGDLRDVIKMALQNLDSTAEDLQQVLKVFSN